MGLTGTLGLFIESTGRTVKNTASLLGLTVCQFHIVYDEDDDDEGCGGVYDDMR